MPKPKRPHPACAIATAISTRAAWGDTPLIGAYMARHRLLPDRVIVSPAAAHAPDLGAFEQEKR